MLDTLWFLMLLFYVPACAGLIIIVLLQKGKGVGFAGAFGIGGGSDTVFGPRASKSLPQRLTYVAAALFMILAMAMSLISGRLGKGEAPDMIPEPGVMGVVDSSTIDGLGSGLDESEAPEDKK
ncbi:MAG: preprotein translocase subunit SecG [Nitrospiraceae bacterium]|nr:preprotein translocase subunit SecG [Nitrospiraceae bacterium]